MFQINATFNHNITLDGTVSSRLTAQLWIYERHIELYSTFCSEVGKMDRVPYCVALTY